MRARWQQLQSRERSLILLAAALIAMVLFWTLFWEPLQQSREDARARIAEQQSLLLWLESIAPEVQRLRASQSNRSVAGNRSPISLIDQTARAAGLAGALQRIEPAAGNQVRVVFEQVEFAALMQWLSGLLAEQPFAVEQFNAQRGLSRGRVDVVLVLATGRA
ncbi:MAG: type II secretion system protein GspM [Pseudomonadota bacterium]